MMRIVFLFIFAVLSTACSVEPVAINFGTDACHRCKMTIVDEKFGGEVVTKKGKSFKFDDLFCMVNYLNSGEVSEDELAFRLVVDYLRPGKLIPAGEAFYVKSARIRSPMSGNVASFHTEKAMEEHKAEWKGIYLTWGELTTQFK